MHGRHRSPAERSAPAGGGGPHSGYRSFGRGGGGYRRSGGHPKPAPYAPPPPPPRRKADVLLEAGRLAAEYLVAKGLLPASSLPPPPPPVAAGRFGGEGGRASALSRLGRRRFDDDDVAFESRNHKGRGGRRRHRNGSYDRHGSEWGRENGRGETWLESGRGYSDAVDNDEFDRPRRWGDRDRGFLDTVDGGDLDRRGGVEDTGHGDGGVDSGEASKAAATDEISLPSKSEGMGESESELENHKFADDNAPQAMEDSEAKVDTAPEGGENLCSKPDDVRATDLEMEEAEKVEDSVESGVCGEAEQKIGLQEEGDLAAQPCSAAEDKQAGNHGINLLSLCGFAKVPTKPRSLIANRSPKTDQTPNAEGKGTNDDTSTGGVLGASTKEVPTLGLPSDVPLTDQPQSSRGHVSEVPTLSTSDDSLTGQHQSSRDAGPGISISQVVPLGGVSVEHDLMSSMESGCTRSDSISESSFVHQHQETSEGPPGFESSGKLVDARTDEGLAELVKKEAMKRQREWSQSLLPQTDEYFRNLRAKPSDLAAGKILPNHEMVEAVKEEPLRDADSFPKVVVDSGNKLGSKRQLASSSFKICDLNLVEATEVTDIPDAAALECIPITAPPVSGNNMSMDFGLSIGQQHNETDGYGHHSSIDKVVQVIDLEDDSPVQVTSFDTSKAEPEPLYPNLENFLNHSENPVVLPDIQDGYGLAISEFLGNDIAGCPAVEGDISNLQTGMPFHGAAGITADDDSLYVTLGEIPIGFMDVWDQPPPEYGKFF